MMLLGSIFSLANSAGHFVWASAELQIKSWTVKGKHESVPTKSLVASSFSTSTYNIYWYLADE